MKRTQHLNCSSVSGHCSIGKASARRRASKGERGQSMIELALLLPMMLLILLGVIEFGRAAYFYLEVADAAKAGAQFGSQSMANAVNGDAILQAAQNNAVDLPTSLGASGAFNTQITCTCPGTGTASPCGGALGCAYPTVYLTVEVVNYPLQTLFAYPGIPTTFSINNYSTTMVQRQ
jgi:Flp pilus assembly protein TadG